MDSIFGALPITPDEIFKQLQDLAKQLKASASSTERTDAVNGLLHKLGKERGHELYYKGQPEFLLDFVWWEKVNGKERSSLGMESEWGSPAEVEADFSKLLSYKAGARNQLDVQLHRLLCGPDLPVENILLACIPRRAMMFSS